MRRMRPDRRNNSLDQQDEGAARVLPTRPLQSCPGRRRANSGLSTPKISPRPLSGKAESQQWANSDGFCSGSRSGVHPFAFGQAAATRPALRPEKSGQRKFTRRHLIASRAAARFRLTAHRPSPSEENGMRSSSKCVRWSAVYKSHSQSVFHWLEPMHILSSRGSSRILQV